MNKRVAHIVPKGVPAHENKAECWCKPTFRPVENHPELAAVYVHHTIDSPRKTDA